VDSICRIWLLFLAVQFDLSQFAYEPSEKNVCTQLPKQCIGNCSERSRIVQNLERIIIVNEDVCLLRDMNIKFW
jgi:hypothetical protein